MSDIRVGRGLTEFVLAIALGCFLMLLGALAVVRLLPGGHWVLVAYAVGMPILAIGILGLGFLRAARGLLVAVPTGLAVAGLLISAGIEVAVLFGNPPGPWATAVAVGGLAAESLFAVVMLVDGSLPRLPLVAIAVLAGALGMSAYLAPDYVAWGSVLLPIAWLALSLDITMVARLQRQTV